MRLKRILIWSIVLSVFIFSSCFTLLGEFFPEPSDIDSTNISKNIKLEVDKFTNEKVYRHKDLKYKDFEFYYKQSEDTYIPYVKMSYKDSKDELEFIKLEIASSNGQLSIPLEEADSSIKEVQKKIHKMVKPPDSDVYVRQVVGYESRYEGEYDGPITIEQAIMLYQVFLGSSVNSRVVGRGAKYKTFNATQKYFIDILHSFAYAVEGIDGLANYH